MLWVDSNIYFLKNLAVGALVRSVSENYSCMCMCTFLYLYFSKYLNIFIVFFHSVGH